MSRFPISKLTFHALVLVALPLVCLAGLGGIGYWAGLETVPAMIFNVMAILYLIHAIFAFRAARDSTAHVKNNHVKKEKYSYSLFDCIEYYDGKLTDAWVYAVISLVFPVFLSVLIDTSSFMGGVGSDSGGVPSNTGDSRDTPSYIGDSGDVPSYTGDPGGASNTGDSGDAPSYIGDPDSRSAMFVYYVSLTAAIVLITLEVSHIHMLRKSAADWLPYLAVSLVFDVIVLIALHAIVLYPSLWEEKGYYPSRVTVAGMATATVVAAVVTSSILLFARVASDVNNEKIDVRKFGVQEDGEDDESEGGIK